MIKSRTQAAMNSAGFDDKFATEKAQRGAATMMGTPETRNQSLP